MHLLIYRFIRFKQANNDPPEKAPGVNPTIVFILLRKLYIPLKFIPGVDFPRFAIGRAKFASQPVCLTTGPY